MTFASPSPGPDAGTHIRVKVVPGASRSRIAGLLGDRLRVQIAAPPERGKANAALLALFAKHLDMRAGELRVVQGQTNPQKTVHVPHLAPADVERRLAA